MTRYIDAGKIDPNDVVKGRSDFAEDIRNAVRDLIFRQPTADVRKVRHGKWIGAENYSNGNYKYECSKCQAFFNLNDGDDDYHYCPHCGARMDGEVK